MVNYQNGKIYKIEDVGGNMCYIGSTTKEHLAQRMAEHRKGFRHWQKTGNGGNYTAFQIFEKYGVENCRIILEDHENHENLAILGRIMKIMTIAKT